MTDAPPTSGDASTPESPVSGSGLLATAAFTRKPAFAGAAPEAGKPAAFSLKAPIPISRTTMGTGVGRPPSIQSFRKPPTTAGSPIPPPLPETMTPPDVEAPIQMEDVVRPVAPLPVATVAPPSPVAAPSAVGQPLAPPIATPVDVPVEAPSAIPAPIAAAFAPAPVEEPVVAPVLLEAPTAAVEVPAPPAAPVVEAPAAPAPVVEAAPVFAPPPPAPVPPAVPAAVFAAPPVREEQPAPGPFAAPQVPIPTSTVAAAATLPAPGAAPNAPSALPATAPPITTPPPVSPAASWQSYAPPSSSSAEDSTFYSGPPVPKETAQSGPARNEEADVLSATPPRVSHTPRSAQLIVAAVVLALAGGASWFLTRGSDDAPPPVKSTYAEATGTTPVAVQVDAAATTGPTYYLSLPVGWTATSQLVGPASHHTDVALTRPVVGITGQITSRHAAQAADPKASVPQGSTDITTQPVRVAGVSAVEARWTSNGISYTETTYIAKGVAYELGLHAPTIAARELYADTTALRKSITFKHP